MQIKRERVIKWYDANELNDESFDSFGDLVQGMVAIEFLVDTWSDVVKVRETGIPSDAVLIFFQPLGIDLEYLESSTNKKQYLLSHTNSDTLQKLLTDEVISILEIKAQDDCIRIECEAKGSEILE